MFNVEVFKLFYKVKDILFVDFGCCEIMFVENEMFGLMVFWVKYGELKFLKGVCIVGCLYMII